MVTSTRLISLFGTFNLAAIAGAILSSTMEDNDVLQGARGKDEKER